MKKIKCTIQKGNKKAVINIEKIPVAHNAVKTALAENKANRINSSNTLANKAVNAFKATSNKTNV